MTLANTSLVSVQYKPETAFGVTPAAGTNYYDLRVTGESLDFGVTKTDSAEINSTRSISSQTPTSAAASGGFNFEFSHGEYDRFLVSTLQAGSWTTTGTTNGVLPLAGTLTVSATSITTSNPADALSTVLARGQWFRLSKTGGLNDNKLFRVAASGGTYSSTVIPLDTGTPGVVETTASSYSLQTARIANGTTQSSFSIQRKMNDTSPLEYFVYRGMTPSKFALNIASGSLTTGSFDFMGKDALRFTGANNPLSKGIVASTGALDTGTSTLATSLTGGVHAGVNATNCVLWAGGTAISGTYIKSVALDYDNGLRSQEAVCNLGAVAIGSGTIKCSVKMQLYFAEGAKFFTEFLANTTQEIAFSTADSTGQCYVFTLPAANVADYKVNAGGKDSDLLVDVSFTGLRDSTLSKVLVIDRCGAAVTP